MDFFEVVKQRRSVKHFDPHHQLKPEEVDRLIEMTLYSPTSFNIQNWRFVIVEDKKLREDIRKAAWNQAQITEASLLIVLCADLHSWGKDTERYWRNAPEEVRARFVSLIHRFYADQKQLQRDEALRSCGIAAQTLMLSAKAMGYDSCPMVGYDAEEVARIIRLPEDHVIGLIVVIGKALKPPRERGGQLPVSDVIVKDHF